MDAMSDSDSRSFAAHARQILHDAHVLAAAVGNAAARSERYLAVHATSRPYETLGVAAGIGYALGRGLGSRRALTLLGAATRLAMALAARELGVRLLQGAPPSARENVAQPRAHALPRAALLNGGSACR
jgi:hypothetical protein